VKTLRVLLGAVVAAVALAGHAQQRPHGGGGMGRGFFRPGAYARAPQGYGRGFPGYGGQRFAPRQQPFAPQSFPPAYAPAPGYGSYAPPYAPGGGAWRNQQEFLRQGVRQGQLAPLGGVIQNIRRVTPGRQLDAGLEYMGPRLVYRVRWMTARGRRLDYFVDAATGAIISGR